MTWADTTVTSSTSLGNFSRFVDADPIGDGTGGIDFTNTFSSENPFVFTATKNAIEFTAAPRENP